MPLALTIIEKTPFSDEEKDLLRRILDGHISTLINALAT
jgi:hypothetical protein